MRCKNPQLTFDTIPINRYSKDKLFLTEQRERNEFLFEIHKRGYIKDAFNISMCGQKVAWFQNDKYNLEVPASCDNRSCVSCNKKRALKNRFTLKDHLIQTKSNFNNLRFITLTYNSCNTKEQLNYKLTNLSKDVRAYIKRLKSFGYNILSGYRVTELVTHEKGSEKYHILESGKKEITGFYKQREFHLHIHMLYFANLDDCKSNRVNFNKYVQKNNILKPNAQSYILNKNKYLAYDFCFIRQNQKDGFIWNDLLSSVWEKSSSDNSIITDPKRVTNNMDKAVNYLSDYISKGFFDINLPVNTNADIFEAIRGKRLIQKFGVLFSDFTIKKYTKGSFYHRSDVIEIDDIIYPYDDAIPFTFGYYSVHKDFINMSDVVYIKGVT